MSKEEVWLPVTISRYSSYYEVSNLGRVRRTSTGKSIGYLNEGYVRAVLCANGERAEVDVHRLVALAFLGPPPDDRQTQVRHLNGLNQDNRAANLAWGGYLENGRDRVSHRLQDRMQLARIEGSVNLIHSMLSGLIENMEPQGTPEEV